MLTVFMRMETARAAPVAVKLSADPVSAGLKDGVVELDNGLVKARFIAAPGGVRQAFLARNDTGRWDVVVESLHPPTPFPAGATRLLDAGASKHRYLANAITGSAELQSHTPEEAVVKLAGEADGISLIQTVRLRRGERRVHTEVQAKLAGIPARLEYLLSAFTFNLDHAPSFVHTPTLKSEGRWPAPADQQVLGDRCFHSPAIILQERGLFVGASTVEDTGYRAVARHLWQRFGHPVFVGDRHLAMPMAEYATTVRDVIFKSLSVQPGVAGYPDTGAFLEFEPDGRRVGGFRNAAPFWLDVLGNTEFWNNVRDATGMYEWGKRLNDPSLCDKARRIIELALAAPRNPQGVFPLIYPHPNIYPFGLGPENIDHEGHPQSAMRTSPSWGEASSS